MALRAMTVARKQTGKFSELRVMMRTTSFSWILIRSKEWARLETWSLSWWKVRFLSGFVSVGCGCGCRCGVCGCGFGFCWCGFVFASMRCCCKCRFGLWLWVSFLFFFYFLVFVFVVWKIRKWRKIVGLVGKLLKFRP